MIEIKLNKELDKEIYLDFVDLKFGGADFGEKIRKDHPDITKENYSEYIDEYYKTKKGEIESSGEDLKKEIDSKQKLFFASIKNVFGFDFSDIENIGYLSIFDCNPRWPENKTFQIFYKRSLVNRVEVVFHELAHFAFFEYFDKNFQTVAPNYSKNNGPLWELSEIFNVILLNLPEFIEVTGREEELFYPALTEKLKLAQEEWVKRIDLKDFIKKVLEMLDKQNI
ncbi:MAG: hypothetical protein WC657_04555 [Candidatus Paceibacterota bacterium]|jgi:hypothetical protein